MWRSRTRAIGFLLYGTTESRHPAVLGIRQTADGEDALDCGSGIVQRIDLRRADVKFAQPNGRVRRIERHGAILQETGKKTKATLSDCWVGEVGRDDDGYLVSQRTVIKCSTAWNSGSLVRTVADRRLAVATQNASA